MSVDITSHSGTTPPWTGQTGPVLDVVVPVHNEDHDLERSVQRLQAYLTEQFPYPFRVTVADNASTDTTPLITAQLANVLAERAGLRIHEVPVGWIDDPESSVDIIATAKEDLMGIARPSRASHHRPHPRRRPPRPARPRAAARPRPAGVLRGMIGQLLRFAVVGVASTLAYLETQA